MGTWVVCRDQEICGIYYVRLYMFLIQYFNDTYVIQKRIAVFAMQVGLVLVLVAGLVGRRKV